MLNTEGLKTTLKQKIKAALDASITDESDSNTIKDNFANAVAGAIADGVDSWIKTATITVQPGIVVSTPAGPGSTTSTGTCTIS